MAKNNDVLKMLARQAKNRLTGTNLVSKTKREFKVYVNTDTVTNVILSEKDDEALYKKVVGLLDKDDEINAVSYIIDKKYYNSLDDIAKQRYFLTTLDKYRKFKQKYISLKDKGEII